MVTFEVEQIEQKFEHFTTQSINAVNETLLSEKEKMECAVYGDSMSHMTSSRLFARYMSRFSFYNPIKKGTQDISGGPSLDAAWAYYEHVTLARVYAKQKDGEGNYVRAQVGESRPTILYPYSKTTLRDLKSFGISVRLYFSTVMTIAFFLLGAGVLNLPLFSYYWDYGVEGGKKGMRTFLRGSAVCGKSEWVKCESCNDQYQDYFPSYRLDGENVLKHTCNFEDWGYAGVHSWVVSMILVAAFFIAFFVYQKRAEISFDEEIQTTSDYSIKITNPPADAYDPEEWKLFFGNFTDDIVSISIGLNNAELLNFLVQRRKLIQQLKKILPIGADLNSEDEIIKACAQKKGFKLPFTSNAWVKYKKIQKLNKMIKLLCERKYKVASVFVIFESERGQRNVLHALSTSRLNIWRNVPDTSKFRGGLLEVRENMSDMNMDGLPEIINKKRSEVISINLKLDDDNDEMLTSTLMFRGKRVLSVKKAPEPFDVRWKDLQVEFYVRFLKCIVTVIALVWFISWSGFFIYSLSKKATPALTTIYISITNVIVPKICEFINSFEPHATEGKRQASLYVKMALFRCFNSAVALLIVTDFIEIISIEDGNEQNRNSVLYSVYPVICAELFTIPIIKLCDFMGNYRKHILAPRARDQEEMNSYMRGGKFELAERYTDSTKVLFVALMYSSILPESFFLGAIACFTHYFFGKFCLLRMWRKAPDIGTELARISRNSFFTTSFMVHLLACAYFWSGFPYDFVCVGEDEDDGYQFCNQDMFGSRVFPLPRFQSQTQWMTPSQEKITSLYGWSSLVAIVIGSFLMMKIAFRSVESIFKSTYEPGSKDQCINFHQVKHLQDVQAYIPQIIENGFEYPLIACDIEKIDHDLLGWRDHFHGFEPHNLTNDIKVLLGSFPKDRPIFSIVKCWPQKENFDSHR